MALQFHIPIMKKIPKHSTQTKFVMATTSASTVDIFGMQVQLTFLGDASTVDQWP